MTSLAYPWTRKNWHAKAGLVARLRASYLILRGHENELCGLCGRRVEIIWWSDEDLWQDLTGWVDGSGIACVRCYDRLAYEHDVHLRWKVDAL